MYFRILAGASRCQMHINKQERYWYLELSFDGKHINTERLEDNGDEIMHRIVSQDACRGVAANNGAQHPIPPCACIWQKILGKERKIIKETTRALPTASQYRIIWHRRVKGWSISGEKRNGVRQHRASESPFWFWLCHLFAQCQFFFYAELSQGRNPRIKTSRLGLLIWGEGWSKTATHESTQHQQCAW